MMGHIVLTGELEDRIFVGSWKERKRTDGANRKGRAHGRRSVGRGV
jgi:hypothetical protein